MVGMCKPLEQGAGEPENISRIARPIVRHRRMPGQPMAYFPDWSRQVPRCSQSEPVGMIEKITAMIRQIQISGERQKRRMGLCSVHAPKFILRV